MFKALRLRSLETRREEALSDIRMARSAFEVMVKRAEISGIATDDSAKGIQRQFETLESRGTQASKDELDDLVDESVALGGLRAYFCPPPEILAEGQLKIDLIEEWGVPSAIVAKLRKSLTTDLANSDPAIARGALRAVIEEFDSWDMYAEDYNETMLHSAYILASAIVVFSLLAIYLLHTPGAIVYGLFAAGAVGGCVSVIAKMPSLSLSSEFEAYPRRILSRIATGLVASMMGCALLGWGLIPISIANQTFSDLVNACAEQARASCTEIKILILFGIPTLFGFSERALTSFEDRIFGYSKAASLRKTNVGGD